MRVQLGSRGLFRKRHVRGKSHVKRCPETVNVGPRVDLAAFHNLLGRDVIGRAQAIVAEHHRKRKFFVTTVVNQSQAKVQNPRDTCLFNQEVGRLDISMNDSGIMRRLQGLGRLKGNVTRHRPLQCAKQRDQFVKADSANQFHHQIVDRTCRIQAIGFDNVGMRQTHSCNGFEFQTCQHAGVQSVLGRQHFQSHLTIFMGIFCDEDASHPAESKEFANTIAINDQTAISAFQKSLGLKRGQHLFANQSTSGLFRRRTCIKLQLLLSFIQLRRCHQPALQNQLVEILCCHWRLHNQISSSEPATRNFTVNSLGDGKA